MNQVSDSQRVIPIENVLEYMDTGQSFNITYVTADEKRGTGGKIIRYEGWQKCNLETIPEVILRRNKVFELGKKIRKEGSAKNRLIINPATHDIRTVHIRLICEFNGKRVI
jgi:hypothetical protein